MEWYNKTQQDFSDVYCNQSLFQSEQYNKNSLFDLNLNNDLFSNLSKQDYTFEDFDINFQKEFSHVKVSTNLEDTKDIRDIHSFSSNNYPMSNLNFPKISFDSTSILEKRNNFVGNF